VLEGHVADQRRDVLDARVEDLQGRVALLLQLFGVHADVADLAQTVDGLQLEAVVGHEAHHDADGVVHEDVPDGDPGQEVRERVQHTLYQLHPEDAAALHEFVQDFGAERLDLLEFSYKLVFQTLQGFLLQSLLSKVKNLFRKHL